MADKQLKQSKLVKYLYKIINLT